MTYIYDGESVWAFISGQRNRYRFGFVAICGAFVLLTLLANCASAETGAEAWLRYARLGQSAAEKYASLPKSVVVLGDSSVLLDSARSELCGAFAGCWGVCCAWRKFCRARAPSF